MSAAESAPTAAAASAPRARPFNFNAGPAALPESVLLEAQSSLLSYRGTGMSVMEMSHRSNEFEQIMRDAEADCRQLLSIPASYRVLFMQGGGTTQFSAVPLNLCATPQQRVQYLVTGAWSQAAQQEATKYAQASIVDARASPSSSFTTLPSVESVRSQIDPSAAFVYACANETVHGVEWGSELEQLFSPASSAAASDPASPVGPVLVSDMSSSFMSQPVDVSRYGLIYAGAQKNVGGAGVTIVVVRDSLLRSHPAQPCTPLMLQYALQADKGSMYNTPPTFSIYVTGLVFKWLLAQGGLAAIGERNAAKAHMLYGAIDASQGFYRAFVAGPHRSRMNVVFTVAAANDPQARDDKLNAVFVKQAEAQGLVGLAGHRSVGGLRASLYNAVSIEAVQALVDFMKQFQNSQQAAVARTVA